MTTDDTVTAKLAEWETLTEAATPGAWVVEESDYGEHAVYLDEGEEGFGTAYIALEIRQGHDEGRADAEFIAAARTAMPALLGFVEDVRALHVSSSESRGVGRVDPETGEWGAYCDHDGEWWPCPTVQALTERIGGA